MSYTRQTFTDWELDDQGNVVKEGTTLGATHLKHIEDGIVANETAAANAAKTASEAKTAAESKQPKGNYLTEHQKLKTINGQSIVGEGDIQVAASAAQSKTGFEGKVISVLGDSISAMQGYIPVADGFNLKHDQQYATNFGVDNMWWKIVIDRLGAKLGICDAWDGTTVKNTASEDSGKTGPNTYLGSSTRLINLGSNGTPDMILIFAGTNDTRSGTASNIGTFDASVEYVPMTEDEVYTNTTSGVLAEAYTALIRKLQYLYPTTKLVALAPMYGKPFALYPQARMMSLKVIRDVCDYFGVLLLDPVKAGLNINNTYTGNTTYFKDGIHPNKDGMKLIGDYVYKQVVNTFEVNEGENVVYSVTNQLDTLTTSKPHVKGVSKGTTYTAKLSGTTDFTGVKVYMGVSDVTGSALAADGTITITNVSGAIVIADKNIEPPTIQTYSVTFEENGGSAVADLTGQTELPNPLPTTTRSGYTFGGWYTNSGLTAAANPGATLTANVTLYAKWTEIVEPDDGDEGGSGGTVIDPASITWYADNSSQTGKTFNYNQIFPGCAVGLPVEDAALLRGVPINVVKFMPSAAGKMFFAKWVPGSAPVKAATIEIPADDVYSSAPDNSADARIYLLSNTITLADDEYLLCKYNDPSTAEDSGGFWVNAGGSSRFKAYVWSTADNSSKAENWGVPFGFGYQK